MSNFAEKTELISSLLATEVNGGEKIVNLGYSLRGNILYALFVRVSPETGDEVSPTWIEIFKLKKTRNQGWSATGFFETDAPAFYNVPQKFLKAADVLNQDWRDAVSKFQAGKQLDVTSPLKVGDKVEFALKDESGNLKTVNGELTEKDRYSWLVTGTFGTLKVKATKLTRV